MKTTVLLLSALIVAATVSATGPTLSAGSVTLTLGMSRDALLAQLPAGTKLKWSRDTLPAPVVATPTPTGTQYESRTTVDGKPVTFRYSDDHGVHGWLVDASGEHLVFVTFEGGKLTAARRLLLRGTPQAPATAAAAAATISRVLSEWRSHGEGAVVETTHVKEQLDEIVFRSGQRRLVVLSSGEGNTSITESIGREERQAISYSP